MKKVFVIVLAVFLFDMAILLIGAIEIAGNPLILDALTKHATVREFDTDSKSVKGNKINR